MVQSGTRLEGPGLDYLKGKLWALAACPTLRIVAANSLRWGWRKGPFFVKFACSSRVSLVCTTYSHKNMQRVKKLFGKMWVKKI